MARVLLLCMEILGTSMAGPAIRYWEFAKALSKKHTVTLMSPNVTDLSSDTFTIKQHNHQLPSEEIKKADIIISQRISYRLAIAAKRAGAHLILDAYDPEPLEHLEIFRNHPMKERELDILNITATCLLSMFMADGVICANEAQKDLWTGLLMNQGRLTPKLYDQDRNLNFLINTVPFGLSSEPPQRSGQGLKERFKLKPEDHVLLWGGGIWNWFDPLTLIKAVHALSLKRDDIKLVFMGIKHPNPIIPQMKMASDAIDLAKHLGILDKQVFVNYGWLPYNERQNFLLDASIGVSNHFDNLETRYAFRTRILDYIWAGLPIITTQGDSFADLVTKKHLGLVVPYQDSLALAKAIEEIIDNPKLAAVMRKNLESVRPFFYWVSVTQPILTMIEGFVKQPKSCLTIKDLIRITQYLAQKVYLRLLKVKANLS